MEEIGIGGDMNGHVGCDRTGYDRVHGGYGFGLRNDAGRKVLDFATAYELAIVNTYFRKRGEHYVTYKSGRNMSQIDYFMVRRESVTTQHRLMVMETWCIKKRSTKREKVNKEARIRWWKLCDENEEVFTQKMRKIGLVNVKGSIKCCE
ncbi:uncharacterized protein LOC132946637 [Metopolophium dirhodum]|uniref:uncharacterized protein LOC132946637 n=1 Tax=Metopolophium dirhodum TaxID=44670 RepID=UPI0029905DDC|nr:uncharacterized protein LOC132946637 [Metopolophium dirhodum]